ncbi:MAG: penicillin-binding protein activator [Arenimonas sp.]
MRLPVLSLFLLPVLLIGCSEVRVIPSRGHSYQSGEPGRPVAVRSDRANTEAFPPGDSDGYRPPAQVAVLLPMSGSLAPAGASVRDGFLAAYYAENRRRPVVKFYDSQGSAGGAQAAAAKALADGAQMIVGPLTRDEVNAVAAQADHGPPMISLNRGAQSPARGSTSFALLPDEEGAAAANRLLDRGLASALVFSNRSDNAQRAVAAFRDSLRKRGASIALDAAVPDAAPDLNAQLTALLASPAPPKAVFLAMDAAQARALVAQLKLSPAAGLPRIATSQILSGANARADVELDGIEYPELPWLLNQVSDLPEPATLSRTLASARGPAQRLFAFGADAWKLVAYYERLYNDPSFSMRGATGALRIDVAGPVQRIPAWAVFSGGRGRASEGSRAADADQPAH